MNYQSGLKYVCNNAVEYGIKVGAGVGLVGMILLAANDESLRAEGDISVGYGMAALGILGSAAGAAVGMVAGYGLEFLTDRLYISLYDQRPIKNKRA